MKTDFGHLFERRSIKKVATNMIFQQCRLLKDAYFYNVVCFLLRDSHGVPVLRSEGGPR